MHYTKRRKRGFKAYDSSSFTGLVSVRSEYSFLAGDSKLKTRYIQQLVWLYMGGGVGVIVSVWRNIGHDYQ